MKKKVLVLELLLISTYPLFLWCALCSITLDGLKVYLNFVIEKAALDLPLKTTGGLTCKISLCSRKSWLSDPRDGFIGTLMSHSDSPILSEKPGDHFLRLLRLYAIQDSLCINR